MPNDEKDRLEALESYAVYGTAPEEAYDNITRLAKRLFDVPIAMINFINADCQWTKSSTSFEAEEVDREVSFCTHTIAQATAFIVEDTLKDPRFDNNPFVTGKPEIRFYAGTQLVTPDGHHVGALCLIDYEPRPALDDENLELLDNLAALVVDELELRKETRLHREEVERRAEIAERLEQNTERLQTALTAASMAVWEWNTHTDEVHMMSKLSPDYGVDQSELTVSFEPLLEKIVDEDRDETRRTFERARDAESLDPTRFRIRLPDGELAWLEVLGRRRSPDSGTFVGAVRDVTVEQSRLREIRESEKNFKRVLDSLPFAVGVVDAEEIIYANAAAERLLGIDTSQLPTSAAGLVHPDSRESVARRLQQARESADGQPLEPVEHKAVRRDGQMRYVESTAFSASFLGKDVVISVLRDTTEEKELLARMMQMDRVAAVGTLSAGVGHEINNPLSYIRGNLDYAIRWLQKRAEEHENPDVNDLDLEGYTDVVEAMNEAREGTQRIREITRDLRRLSSSPDQEFETYPTDVNTVLDSAAKLAHHELKRRARLERDYNADIDVIAEPSRLGQAVLNVLLNAAKAFDSVPDTNDKVVRISSYEKDDMVVVEVEDNGCGIPADRVDSVFDAFFTTRTTGEGTGLGLTTAQSSIEKMGGRVELESTEGEGTLVRIVLEKADALPELDLPQR